MENVKDKIMENKAASITIAAIVVLIVILGVLLGTGKVSLSNDNQANVAVIQYDENGNPISGDSEMMKDHLADDDLESASFMTIKIPVFADPDMFDYVGKKTVCGDELVWASVQIAPTQMPLNATLQALFNRPNDLGFSPGNFIATQSELSFEKATIENGVAQVYINGEFTFSDEDDCDAARAFIQLEESALQFSTVNAVQIYLNGELLR